MRRRTKFLLLGLLLLMVVAAGIGTVAAALFLYRGDDTTRVEPLPPPPEKTKLAYPVLGSWLDQLVAMVESGAVSAREAAANAPIHDDESVAVSIYLSGHVEEVAEFLRDNGGDPRNLGEDYIEALVPVPLLGRTSERPGVLRVREIVPPMATQAAVVSQGAGEHGSPLWNQRGYTGRGVKVGVIDLGFHGVRGLLGTELPESINTRCYTAYANPLPDLRACEAPSRSDHGTMVAEAIIDVAPDASLYIANPFTRVDFRRTVDWMIEEGVSVINHSAGWPFGGPGDGSSPYFYDPLQTVDRAVEAGIVWVNSAGNNARGTWFGSFTDPDGNGYMSFDDSTRDENNGFRASAGSRILIDLRWDDRWGGATIDLDLFLVRRDPQSGEDLIVRRSEHPQMGNQGDVPYERLRWLSRGGGEYGIRVVKRSGAAPQWVQLVLASGKKIDHSTQQRGIGSPAESANPGMLAVGAAPWYDVRSIESYSSRGPTPDGRVKPDIVGATCAEASLAPLRDGRRGFCGTSQAAPHVAGMAALVRQRFPQFSPEEVVDYLKSQAEQRGSGQPNNTWGYGFAKLPDPPKNCRHSLERAGPLSTESFFKEWIQGCDSAVQGRGRAQYFTIVLGGQRDMVFTLESGDADAYLYLREGRQTSGPALYENDNHSAGSTDSRISGTPASGIYTIEATTSSPGQTGDFTLTVEALDSALSTQEDPAETESSAPEPPKNPNETEGTGPLSSAGEFVSVSAATSHTCGVRRDGSVQCWGSNEDPDGEWLGQATPSAGEFDSVSAGFWHTCGVMRDGSVECWGWDSSGQATPPAGEFALVSAGSHHTCGLKRDGTVDCWGYDKEGQASPPDGEFISVSAGSNTCGVRRDGSVECWGVTAYGSGVRGGQFTLPILQLNYVNTGAYHTCGVSRNGSVECWGADESGQSTPPAGEFASVSAGGRHTCAVRSDGSVECWGWDLYGQATPPPEEFASVSAGFRHTCGVRRNGSVACWGSDGDGQATPPADGISYAFQSFHVISSALDEYGDHDAECKSRLGNQYRLADWNDLTSWVSGGGSIPELIAGLRLRKEGDPASIYPHDGAEIDGSLPKVSLDGEERLKNGRRHFFISRHDHVLPGYFLAHAHIDNYHISLGSWYVEGGTTLCYNPTP